MGGYQVPGHGSGDDGYDADGYDESQRAEILEATGDGPDNGAVLTDLTPDLGEDEDDDAGLDDLHVIDDEDGEPDEDDAELDEADREEDEIQEDFDDAELDPADLDAELDDGEAAALAP